MTAERLRRKAR